MSSATIGQEAGATKQDEVPPLASSATSERTVAQVNDALMLAHPADHLPLPQPVRNEFPEPADTK